MLHGLWRIELFGRLRALNADRCVDRFRTEKTGVLLAYLAYFGDRAHPRELLADMLWPGSDAARGRMSLRTGLASLRRQLEPPGTRAGTVLAGTAASVWLHPGSFDTDVAEFNLALEMAAEAPEGPDRARHWAAAADLYRGELLAGYYEDWILPERERLAFAYAETLRRLVRHLVVEHDLPRALGYTQAAVAAAPQSELAHRDLIRLYLALGRADAARQAMETLEEMLRDELGHPPSAATQELGAEVAARAARRTVVAAASHAPAATAPASQAAAPIPPSHPPRIPLQLTAFFGREADLDRLQDLLNPDRGGHFANPTRLVTLTGPGGIGKTRLAIEFARRFGDLHGLPSVFVELADLVDARLIPGAVARTLGLHTEAGTDPIDQIAAADDRPTLLVLDNFEQLNKEGPAFLLSLLSRAPLIRCLVTSRHPLGLSGERELALKPLETPDGPEAPEYLMRFPSVGLFVDRAQSVRSDFQVTPGNAGAVSELCRRLEGVPLALELAAARSQLLTTAQMVAMLKSRFDLLKSGRKDREARHRSLWAATDWSYELLSPELQRFFAALSVFRGSFAPEAAASVCREPRALDYLSQLRAHSLIVTAESAQGMRMRLLESLREFAAEQLSADDRQELSLRHGDHFRSVAEEADPHLIGPEQADWFNRLTDDHDNLRAALAWARDNGLPEPVARIGAAVWRFWWIRGHTDEGLRWLQPVIESGRGALDPNLMGRTLHAAGTLAWASNRMNEAEVFHREALSVRRASGDLDGAARSLGSLGNALRERGDNAAAYDCYLESLELFRKLGDKRLIATSLLNLGTIAEDAVGNLPARTYYEESLTLYRELGDQHSIAMSLFNLANVLCNLSEYETASDLLRECMEIRLNLDSKSQICFLLSNMARVYIRTGRAEVGVELLAAAWTHLNSLGAGIFPTFKSAHEQSVDITHAVLDRDAFERAYAAGQSLSLDEAIHLFHTGSHLDVPR
jgi:predicted ATPase/DNA-binding SARP family transcriptional activator